MGMGIKPEVKRSHRNNIENIDVNNIRKEYKFKV